MSTNCAPLLADLFLYSYEADFIQGLLKKNEKKLARSFNFTFRYKVDVLSLIKSWFGDVVDRIYPIELEIKDTTDTDRSASYLDLHLEMDSEGRLSGFISKYVTISRSICQGCPVAPMLYILQAEPLASTLRANPNIKGIKLPHLSDQENEANRKVPLPKI
jgi:hypothetical protein